MATHKMRFFSTLGFLGSQVRITLAHAHVCTSTVLAPKDGANFDFNKKFTQTVNQQSKPGRSILGRRH